jgi:hypothetical protein
MAMDHPSLAIRSAAARPMPRADAAPVRTTVRSEGKLLGVIWIFLLGFLD